MKKFRPLTLMLFTHDPELAMQAEDAGIDRIVVDFEFRGKTERQSGYHLEVNKATLADLARIRKKVSIPILVRTNPICSESRSEIFAVISEGADILMLPMFRMKEEVEMFLGLAGNKVRKNLLFETKEAVEIAQEVNRLQFDEFYVGLNDMSISYNLSFAYDVLKHNIIGHIRSAIPDRPFGFGGITVVDGGSPLTTKEILYKMAYYGCSLAILRRAFKRDVLGRSMRIEVSKIREAFEALK